MQRKQSGARRNPIEQLESRTYFAVFATFSAGMLTVFGDNLDNAIDVSRDAAGKIRVNGGAVAVTGGTPTVANTNLIQVFGQGGQRHGRPHETNGALRPRRTCSAAPATTSEPAGRARHAVGRGRQRHAARQGGFDFLFGGAARTTRSPAATPTTRFSARAATGPARRGTRATTPT
jgi:hypothetical protein